jgi:hypothetical protein
MLVTCRHLIFENQVIGISQTLEFLCPNGMGTRNPPPMGHRRWRWPRMRTISHQLNDALKLVCSCCVWTKQSETALALRCVPVKYVHRMKKTSNGPTRFSRVVCSRVDLRHLAFVMEVKMTGPNHAPLIFAPFVRDDWYHRDYPIPPPPLKKMLVNLKDGCSC